MLTFFNKRLRNRKGFTLIELIVVIGILGILVAIAVPRLGGFTDQAETAANDANARVIKTAVSSVIAEGNAVSAANVNPKLDGITVADLADAAADPANSTWGIFYDTTTDPSTLTIKYTDADGTTTAY